MSRALMIALTVALLAGGMVGCRSPKGPGYRVDTRQERRAMRQIDQQEVRWHAADAMNK